MGRVTEPDVNAVEPRRIAAQGKNCNPDGCTEYARGVAFALRPRSLTGARRIRMPRTKMLPDRWRRKNVRLLIATRRPWTLTSDLARARSWQG